jgi:hypothetical protein
MLEKPLLSMRIHIDQFELFFPCGSLARRFIVLVLVLVLEWALGSHGWDR